MRDESFSSVAQQILRRKRARVRKVNFESCVRKLGRLLNLSLAAPSRDILNSILIDILDNICRESASLTRSSKKRTLSVREVQSAVRLVLPVRLAEESNGRGIEAVHSLS